MKLSENYFKELYSIDVNEFVKKKNGQNFLPWAKAWAIVKELYPDATYQKYERTTPEGLIVNYFTDGRTCWVKTGVTINGIEHTEDLPIMDFKNNSIPLENVTSQDVNKAIQRSLTKACARHGVGLYLYEGEDLPSDAKKAKKVKDEELTNQKNALIELMGNLIDGGANKDDIYAIISKHNGGKKNPTSIADVEVCAKITAEINKKYKEKK